jgi:hypothetical protein
MCFRANVELFRNCIMMCKEAVASYIKIHFCVLAIKISRNQGKKITESDTYNLRHECYSFTIDTRGCKCDLANWFLSKESYMLHNDLQIESRDRSIGVFVFCLSSLISFVILLLDILKLIIQTHF